MDGVVGSQVAMVMVDLSGEDIAVSRTEPVHPPVHHVSDVRVPDSLRAKGVPGHEVCHSRTVFHASKLRQLEVGGGGGEGGGGGRREALLSLPKAGLQLAALLGSVTK